MAEYPTRITAETQELVSVADERLRLKLDEDDQTTTTFDEGSWHVEEVKLDNKYRVEHFVFKLEKDGRTFLKEYNAENVWYRNRKVLDGVCRSLDLGSWHYRHVKSRRNRRVKERIAERNAVVEMEHPEGYSDEESEEQYAAAADDDQTAVSDDDEKKPSYTDASVSSDVESDLSEKEIILKLNGSLTSDTEDERDAIVQHEYDCRKQPLGPLRGRLQAEGIRKSKKKRAMYAASGIGYHDTGVRYRFGYRAPHEMGYGYDDEQKGRR